MGGRREMGYMGPGLPGQRTVTAPPDRAFVRGRNGRCPRHRPPDVGSGTIDMFERMAAGEIRPAG